MGLSMMANGRKTTLGVMESLLIKMEIIMKGNGLTAKPVEKGNLQGKMVAVIKEDGERIFNMVKENKHGRMVVTIKENSYKV